MWGAAGSFWGKGFSLLRQCFSSLGDVGGGWHLLRQCIPTYLPPPYCLLLTQRHIQMSPFYKKSNCRRNARSSTYLHSYIPSFLHTYIPAYLHTCIPKYLHTLESSGAGLLISWWSGGRLASSGAGLLICWWSGGRLPSSGARARLLISGWSGGRLASSEARLLISW